MTTLYDAHSDEELERRLLAAASGDQPHQSATAAWAQLCGALARASAESPEARIPVDGEPPATPASADARTSVRPPRVAASLRQGVVWLLIGAGGGSLITAAWLAAHDSRTPAVTISRSPSGAVAPPERPESAANRVVTLSAPQPDSAGILPAGGAAAESLIEPDAQALRVAQPVPAPNVSAPSQVVAKARPEARGAPQESSHVASLYAQAPDEVSSLAAQVVALDIARSALRAGMAQRALRLIERYHREYPHSALAPDAEVVALEALAALHNHTQLEDRANAFLERYPRDPHRSRVLGFVRAERLH